MGIEPMSVTIHYKNYKHLDEQRDKQTQKAEDQKSLLELSALTNGLKTLKNEFSIFLIYKFTYMEVCSIFQEGKYSCELQTLFLKLNILHADVDTKFAYHHPPSMQDDRFHSEIN